MLTQEELGSGKNTTKVEQYGWSIVDEIGELMWLSKAILNVDPAYQREKVKLNRILSISRAWSWVACGTLIVAKRTDGKYFVIDGQHRKLAADKRADILNLPCMVFDAVDIPDEASAFLRVNIARSPVGALGKFKSEIIAGDKVAAKVTSMVTESGYRIGASSGPEYSTVCVGLLKQCMVRSEPVTAQVWALCVDLSNGRTITDRLFGSLFELEIYLTKSGHGSLYDRQNLNSLKRAGVDGILQSVAKARLYYSKGGSRVGAEGVLALLNHKRQSRRIPSILDA